MQTTPATRPDHQDHHDPSQRGVVVAAGLAGALAAAVVLGAGLVAFWPGDAEEPVAGLAETGPVASPSATVEAETDGATGTATDADTNAGDDNDAVGDTGTDTGAAATIGGERCEATGYAVTVPTGWASLDCRSFTAGTLASGGDVRTEIDLFWAQQESYQEALTRIEDTLAVRSQQETSVADRPATMFRIVETDANGTTGNRLVIVVDAEDGVFFSSANELIQGIGPIDDRTEHFRQSVEALETMIATVTF